MTINPAWRTATVTELQAEGVLLVEDGNHGENRPRPHEFVADGVAFIRAADLSNGRILFESAERISDIALSRVRKGIGQPGDVLLSHKGTVGKVAFAGLDAEPFVCSPQTTFWRVLNEARLDRKYLFAYLRSPYFSAQLSARKSETDMADYVSLTNQRGLQVVIPPIKVQRNIAHVLGTLDDKIELNRQMNRTLEQISTALFKSWFVDFDPVRAKAAGRQPEGMDAETGALFPDRLVESLIGEIPEGWEIRCLGELLNLERGLSYKGTFLADVGVPLVNLGCFKGHGKYDPSAMKYYTGEYRERHTVNSGDLLIANTDITQRREVIGSPALLPSHCEANQMIYSHHLYAARFLPDRERWRLFVYHSLLQGAFRKRAMGFATGTTVLALPRDAVLEHQFAAPNMELVEAFNSIALTLLERQWLNDQQTRTLEELRDTLLPRLLSGTLSVKLDVLSENSVQMPLQPAEDRLVESRF